MAEKRIKVLLADDTLIAREGWRRIFETTNDIEVIGEATNIVETSELVKDLSPDVLLMDLKWFGDETAGWRMITKIKALYPKVKIIAVTAYENIIKDALAAGADEALTKTFTRSELLGIIREVVSREVNPVPVKLEPGSSLIKGLTPREIDVLNLLARGITDKEIADTLNISVNTAKNHVKSILSKLDAKNRTEAGNTARELGLLS